MNSHNGLMFASHTHGVGNVAKSVQGLTRLWDPGDR